jgi:sRNA-binding carbon storage regulator CsrA
MGLILRLKDKESISIKLEDGREINICIEVAGRSRTVAYIEAPRSILVGHEKIKKEVDESPRNFSE